MFKKAFPNAVNNKGAVSPNIRDNPISTPDDIPLKQVVAFEATLLKHFNDKHKSLMASINADGKLDDAVKQQFINI